MNRFYTCLNNDWEVGSKVLTLNQVRQLILKYKPNVILPAVLATATLEYFGFKELIGEETGVESAYTTKRVKRVRKEGNSFILEIENILDTYKVNEAWNNIRNQRNHLLNQTDWIVSSSDVAEEVKEKYIAYRQLLRDLPEVYYKLEDVVFPVIPEVYMRSKLLEDTELDEKEIDFLKNYTPPIDDLKDWLVFLNMWKMTNYTSHRAFVQNLIKLHTKINTYSLFTSIK